MESNGMSATAGSNDSASVPIVGYDVAATEAWIGANTDAVAPPCTWSRLEGGHSNLTYLLTDSSGATAVVRRPPLGELLPKAHDMGREFTIISGLSGTDVPVPRAYGYCEDPTITGAHFYVMSHVEGRPLFHLEDALEHLGVEARGKVGDSFMDVLSALHSVDPDDVGLGDFAKREDYIGRQMRTWYRSWTASAQTAQYDDPALHALHALLTEHKPEQGPARVVHGDYGLHNCLINPAGEITAVLDWEISTLGDPLADFAYALNGWVESDDEVVNKNNAPTLAPGFGSRQQLIERYEQHTGADLGLLNYYSCFNYWKSACIIHGVCARYMNGQKPTDGVELEEYRARIGACIALSSDAAAAIG